MICNYVKEMETKNGIIINRLYNYYFLIEIRHNSSYNLTNVLIFNFYLFTYLFL